MFLAITVGMPLMFVIVMALVEQYGDHGPLEERLIRVSWDLCVLALGIAGGVCSKSEVIAKYSEPGALLIGIGSVGWSVASAVLIGLLRRQQQGSWFHRLRSLWSLALGGASLAIPAYLAFKY